MGFGCALTLRASGLGGPRQFSFVGLDRLTLAADRKGRRPPWHRGCDGPRNQAVFMLQFSIR